MAKKKPKFQNKIDDFLNKNPLVIYLSSIIAISGVIFAILYFFYERNLEVYKDKLELEYQKNINNLDNERSRIQININEDLTNFDFNSIFIEGDQIPQNYIQIENSPFLIPPIKEDRNWILKESNSAEILIDLNPLILLNIHTELEFLKSQKLHTYEKNETVILNINGFVLNIRPRVTLEYKSRQEFGEIADSLKNYISKYKKIPLISNGVNNVNIENYDPEHLISNVAQFNIFFNMFSMEKESRFSQFLGEYNISEYYFNKDVFLINGYYNIHNSNDKNYKRLYTLKMGILKPNGIYLMSFNLPIKDDFEDVKLTKSLIHGLKILK